MSEPDAYDQLCDQWQEEADAADREEETGLTDEERREIAEEARMDARRDDGKE